MSAKLSPLAPNGLPKMPLIEGVRLATKACGIKYKGRTDVCLIEFDKGTTIAGVLTRSLTASSAVEWCRARLPGGRVRAILINSGNANAFTGRLGQDAVDHVVAATAKAVACPKTQVFVASTGVIGEPLPYRWAEKALPALVKAAKRTRWPAAAAAIMTTDTFPKAATRQADIAGQSVTINGIAKGSGMIAPDMATMLAFVATDAKLPAAVLQALLKPAADASFNSVTVDGDTSTSDTLLLSATGKVRHAKISKAPDPLLKDFKRALNEVLMDLAQQVVRDGEGASKFITIRVAGAISKASARRIGLAIANSPLVKTAIAGEDANWGRIVMAVGKAGEKADRDRLGITIGGVEVARAGQVVPGYDEAPVNRHMKGQEIDITVSIGLGRGAATVWTCDLTHGYIEINADYRS